SAIRGAFGLHRGHVAAVHGDAHVAHPSRRQQRVAREVFFHAVIIARCMTPSGSTPSSRPWPPMGPSWTARLRSRKVAFPGSALAPDGKTRRAMSTTLVAPGSCRVGAIA